MSLGERRAGAAPRPADLAGEQDAASVTIDTTLGAEELRRFIGDVERMLRINPLVEFEAFTALGHDRYRVVSRNLANACNQDVVIEITRSGPGIDIAYDSGLKIRTSLRIEPNGKASRLVIKDVYGGASDEERRARLGEVDTTLLAWGRALHGHLRRWARWRWLAPWRWYMARVWQPLKPSARRIVFMLWIVALFEMLTFLFVVVVWALV